MIKNKLVAFVVYVLVFFAVWTGIGYLYETVITHGTYAFSAFTDGIVPAVVALITGYLVVVKEIGKKK